jgi:CTP:molybdopterin cytidylyltransferase MocA
MTLQIGAVVLAAGGSTRLGRPKQLIVHEGATLVRHAVIAAHDTGARPVIVVLGADAELVAAQVPDRPGIATVFNPYWQTGISSSISAGLKALSDGVDGVLMTLADQPRVGASALERLIAAFSENNRIVASGYSGTSGVPAIFGCEYIPELLKLEGDRGAGAWLRSGSDSTTVVPFPEAEVDVDTEVDVAALYLQPSSSRQERH